jgi:hypothetical protein
MWSPVGIDAPVERGQARYELTYKPGTRHAQAFELALDFPTASRTLSLEPLYHFSMNGIGYTHPTDGHGVYLGESYRNGESYTVAEVDETIPFNQHIQALCRVRRDDGAVGIGILEQLIIGPHEPSGLRELFDMHT